MKLEKFKETDKKKIGIIVFTVSCVLLIAGVFLYKTFALFEVKDNLNSIEGNVQDPGDLYFTFYVDNKISKTMPSKESKYYYDETKSSCTNGATPEFNFNDWSIKVNNFTQSRTKCTLYFTEGNVGEKYTFSYTGSSQEFTAPYDGIYQIELWGASGALGSTRGGYGSYVSGKVFLNKDNKLYLYVGEKGAVAGVNRPYGQLSFNGASGGSYACYQYNNGNGSYNYYGGSGTDVRLVSSSWDNEIGLRSRIMVAGGGASGLNREPGANGGGLIGDSGASGTGGTQTTGGGPNAGSFGKAGVPVYLGNICNFTDRYGAGSGYYGGGASNVTSETAAGQYSAGGGSSYISGHTGCVAIESENNQSPKSGCTTGTSEISCSYHYSGYQFINTEMIDGSGYVWTNQKESQKVMPNPNGGFYDLGIGHTGNGFARIQFLGKNNS